MCPSKVQYEQFRETMQDGDVLLFKGRNLFSKIIQWKTSSQYSHAGIVIWWNKRLMVLEAVGTGVVARPISHNLEHYNGNIDYYRPTAHLTADARLGMAQYAQEQLGKAYAWIRLVGFFGRLVFNLKLERQDASEPSGRYFCSEYVADIYAKFNCDLDIELSTKFTSPDRLAKSEGLELVGTLKLIGDSIKEPSVLGTN